MINTYLENEKVQELLKEIFNNPKYYEKNQEEILKDEYAIHSRILLLFYDALYKYALIIDDNTYLIEFINGFESLIKKLNNIEDIKYGLSKLIGRITCKKMNISYDDIEREKIEVLRFIYDKYIKNGYYIRGLTRPEYINICKTGIIKNIHLAYVDEISKILKKYDYELYENQKLEFNTDFSKACIKSINSPKYLYNIIINQYTSNKDAYYLKDKDKSIGNFKKFLDGIEVNKNDKKDLIELFNNIWNYFNKEDNNIYLVFIKRNKICKIDDYNLTNEFTFDEALYNIFSAYDDLEVRDEVKEEIDLLLELPSYYKYVKKTNSKKTNDKIVVDNEYGMISIVMIIGTIFVLLGVLLSIILV